MLSRVGRRSNLTKLISRSATPAAARANTSLPPSYEKFPLGPRPDVPDTWQASHVDSDQGFFEDDVFPPALPGETLEEYCRRVPNIWSPCSRSTDVVDVRVSTTLEFSQDVNMEDHQFSERPLIKIPPLDSDWHDANEMEVQMANPEEPYTIMGTNPAEVHPEEAEATCKIIMEGAQRVGYGHWFESDNFYDFWIELTGKPITEMPFEKTMDRLLELNPGMTHLDIERRFVPGIGKDEWFLGGNPRMTEEDIRIARESAKKVDDFEANVEAAKAAFDEYVNKMVDAGKFPELKASIDEVTYINEEGERVMLPDDQLTDEQKERFAQVSHGVITDPDNGFYTFAEKHGLPLIPEDEAKKILEQREKDWPSQLPANQ